MRRLVLFAFAAMLVLAGAPSRADTVTIRFVQTNDIDRMEEAQGRGGLARLSAVVKAERAKGPTLFIHSGDTISPSLLSGIDKGAHMIDLLDALAPDAMAPGNHEFDFGPAVFRERMKQKTFDVFAANVREADGSAPAGTKDSKIVEISGVKIGLYGLTTEDTPIVSSPGDIRFASSLAAAKIQAKALREAGADLVVAVVHTPLSVDMLLVRDRLADLVFSGHDEHLLAFFDGRTVLTESGSQADTVIVTTVTVTKTQKDGKASLTWRPSFALVDTASVMPDPEMAALVKGYTDTLDKELRTPIGVAETALDSRRATVRGTEAAIGNLFADALREALAADVAVINGGGIRADRQYEAGATLTRGDILAELPFGNRAVKLEVTGAQLRAALENGLSMAGQGAGRFPQVSGLAVTADLARLPGDRVAEVTVGGVPLDPKKTYTLATNDFMAAGGDGYTAFSGAKALVNAIDGKLMASQVIEWIAAKGRVAPKVEGRLVLK